MKEERNYNVIKKWSEGLITFKTAQLKLGYTTQHMYRLKKRFKEKSKDGFIHGNRGRTPKITIDQSLSDNIVLYYKTEFQGFNFKHFKKMLLKEKGIDVSYSKIYNELTIKNGILSPKVHKKTKKEFKKKELLKKKENKNKDEKELNKIINQQLAIEDATPRIPRSRYFGENVEIDASSFNFFGDIKTHLHLLIDTATDRCPGAFLDYQETLFGYNNAVYQMYTNYGLPITLTSDGRTIFDYMSKRMKTDEKAYFTQFQHACNKLGIDLQVTSKAQKKPRVEKYNAVFQDRLSHELHYKNITTIEEANDYLINTFIPEFNDEFGLKYNEKDSVFEKVEDIESLNYILAVLSTRTFDNGSSIRYKGKIYLPYSKNNKLVCYKKGTKCTVIEAFDKNIYVQVYNEIFMLKELQEKLDENESLEDYYEKINNQEKIKLPKPNYDWDYENLDQIFEKINKEHDIYDSHNPK